jgi:hypothetical protein
MQLAVRRLETTILLVITALVKQVFTDTTNSLIGPTIALVIATGLLVWATWFYAIQTKKIVSETRNTVNEMKSHRSTISAVSYHNF